MDAEHEGGSPVAASPSPSGNPAPIATHGVPPELGSPAALASAGSSSQVSTARSYDVYIGMFGKDPWLIRYAKWMHAELEASHALACFSADRSTFDPQSLDIARSVLHSASHGVVLITRQSFRNACTIEELAIFLSRGNLVPVFFDVDPADCLVRDIVGRRGRVWETHGGELWKAYRGDEKAWSGAVEGLLTVEARRVEAHRENWRDSIREVAEFVTGSTTEVGITEEKLLPWPRNGSFAGREKELKAMEKILFPDSESSSSLGTVAQTLARGSDGSSKAETEVESEVGRLSSYDSENHEERGIPKEIEADQVWGSRDSSFTGLSLRDRRAARAARSYREHKRRDSADHQRTQSHFTPTCVVTGPPGIGKSELAVEFAYRHSQKYRRVLWVGGECRYLRQNYLNLCTPLRVNVGAENTTRPFDEQEASAVHKVRRELERNIPYLLIIDNLDASRDSWDRRELGELLPRSAAHVIITTRLPRVMHLNSVEVPSLSSFDALALMREGKRQSRTFSVQQIDKLKELETKLARLPFALAIVGRLINEFRLKPSELLAKLGTVESLPTAEREDSIFGRNPFLVKLLDVCFDLLCGGMVVKSSVAMRVAYVGGWFAPAPCPLSLLAVAAKKLAKEPGGVQVQTPFVTSLMSCWVPNGNARSDAVDAGARLLTRLGLARVSTRDDCLFFPDIVQTYCRMRGGVPAARSFARAICKSGSVVHHYDHVWAAVYLVCRGYGSSESVTAPPAGLVEFQVLDLLVFTRALVLPLALRAFNAFSRCTASLEALRLCYALLENVEKSYVAGIQDPRWDESLCWRRGSSGPGHQVDEYVWQDLTLLKAVVLEARAKLMLRGGRYDAGEELCRTCISIRTVMLGAEHPDTVAAQATLSDLIRARSR